MGDFMIITAFGVKKEFNKPTTLLDILKVFKEEDYMNYLGAKMLNTLYELSTLVDKDADIEFFDITSKEGMRVYQTTLRYVMSYALNLLYPGTRIIYNYSISRSIFCQPIGLNRLNYDVVHAIENKMNEIISANLDIKKEKIKVSDAIKIYTKEGYKSKVEILKSLNDSNKTISIYKVNDYYNYLDTFLTPSTGFVKNFKLHLYSPGIILQYPRAELGGVIPQFQNETVLSKYLKDQNKWGQITQASYISDFNKIVENDGLNELINLCETRHNNMLAELGQNIERDIENIKLIAVAGPSSSGKTTFTNRLRIELMTRGIKPLMISLDNYYRCDNKYPLNEDGSYDFEHIEALDLELFNSQVLALIDGEEVSLPVFDFKDRSRSFEAPIKLGKNQPILIEGIHALNDRLTSAIPQSNKYQIYIAPQTQLHIDSQSPIALTDIRLIRRIVRDYKTRGASPEKTISMWDSVRKGEFKWIYPHQENADYVFNSELTYELGIMRSYAIEILERVTKDAPEYPTALRLIKVLKHIKGIDSKWVPCNSILREFIGGSIFYEK